MIWGYGETGYGPFRTMRVLGKNTGVEEILLEAAERCHRDGGPDAFECLAPRRPKWLGVAYGSKFLYFCNADTGKPPALLLDRLVKGWLARHAGWQPSLSWFSADYRRYVEKVSCWAEQLSSEGSPVTADDVEYLIFTDAADPGPGCGVVSPILSNIYLDRLDTFVEQELVPAWTRGTVRRRSRAYGNVTARVGYWEDRGDRDKVKAFRKLQQSMPSVDVHDPDYRRLRYVRYADDHLLGFAGTKAELVLDLFGFAAFLRNTLKLELSTEKTLITHARTHKARFLGYDIWTRQADTWHTKGGRSLNGSIALGVPPAAVNARCRDYLRGQSKPLIRNDLIRTSDYNIVAAFGAEYRDVPRIEWSRYSWFHATDRTSGRSFSYSAGQSMPSEL